MRVLTVINSLTLAGAERLVFDLVPRFSARDVDITLMVLKHLDTPLENELHQRGVPFLPTAGGGIYSLSHVPQLARFAGDFDLVHIHLFPAQLWMAIANTFADRRAPIVTTEHNTTNLRRKAWFRPIDRWLYSRYDRILCNSEATAGSLTEWVPHTAGRIAVVANGVDLDRFLAADAPAAASGGVPVLTFIARLEPQKDHPMVFRALARVPHAHLRLLGLGHLEPELKLLARELGIADRVEFLGHRNDVPEVLRATDIYVHCAHSEGFGIAPLEAMAAGRVVVATRNQGLDKVVGDAGILVPPGDSDALAAVLRRLLASPEERRQLGERARQQARRFSIDVTADEHVQQYEDVLRRHRERHFRELR